MMNRLPPEVLHNVFTFLPLIQKRELMFVCSQWKHIIITRSLLHTIYVDGDESLVAFLNLLEQDLRMSVQVEDMSLIACFDTDADKRKSFFMYPNLKQIILKPGKLDTEELLRNDKPTFEELELPLRFPRRLQHVEDFGHCESTLYLIKHNAFQHLVTLVLRSTRVDGISNEVLLSLKNMPILEKMEIVSVTIGIDTLEAIHDNIPSLESLEFKNARLLPCSLPKKKEIIPATNIARLVLSGSSYSRSEDIEQVDWAPYICQKYPNVKHFTFYIHSYGSGSLWEDAYLTGCPLILQKIGPQLESLQLYSNLDTEKQILKELDNYGCQAKEITIDMIYIKDDFFDELVNTDQFNVVERLALLSNDPMGSIDRLNWMKKLKHLELDYCDYGLDCVSYDEEDDMEEKTKRFIDEVLIGLDWVMDMTPKSLESITVRGPFVDYDQCPIYNNIKSLVLDDVKPQKRIDTFITTSFPFLNSLSLINWEKENDTFKLPNLYLSFLEISTRSEIMNVSITTKNNRKTTYYCTDKRLLLGYPALQNVVVPIHKEYLIGKDVITVICGSVKKLVLSGKEALDFKLTKNAKQT